MSCLRLNIQTIMWLSSFIHQSHLKVTITKMQGFIPNRVKFFALIRKNIVLDVGESGLLHANPNRYQVCHLKYNSSKVSLAIDVPLGGNRVRNRRISMRGLWPGQRALCCTGSHSTGNDSDVWAHPIEMRQGNKGEMALGEYQWILPCLSCDMYGLEIMIFQLGLPDRVRDSLLVGFTREKRWIHGSMDGEISSCLSRFIFSQVDTGPTQRHWDSVSAKLKLSQEI